EAGRDRARRAAHARCPRVHRLRRRRDRRGRGLRGDAGGPGVEPRPATGEGGGEENRDQHARGRPEPRGVEGNGPPGREVLGGAGQILRRCQHSLRAIWVLLSVLSGCYPALRMSFPYSSVHVPHRRSSPRWLIFGNATPHTVRKFDEKAPHTHDQPAQTGKNGEISWV